MSFSDYGDDISEPESVASLFLENREEEERKKNNNDSSHSQNGDEYIEDKFDISDKDRVQIYEKFKHCLFEDASNDKWFVLRLKKS